MQQTFIKTTAGPTTSIDAGVGKVFRSLNMKINGGTPTTVVNLEVSPDDTTYTLVTNAAGDGERWGYAGSNSVGRYTRANVVATGGSSSVTVLIAGYAS